MIEHIVSFNLKHAPDSAEERDFLESMRSFADIPGVKNLKIVRQVSSKGPYAFGVSMCFDTQEALDGYDASKEHVDFVADRWLPEVSEWQTLDFVEL